MKRNIIVCALLAAVTAGGTRVWAGNGDSIDQSVKDRACRCLEQENRMPPPPSPEGLIEHMTRQLGLTTEQQTKIKALFAKERVKTGTLLSKLAEYRTQFQAAMNGAPFDEAAIRTIAAGQTQAEIELTVSRARIHSQINTLLTPEQRSRAEKLPPLFDAEWKPGHRPPPPCGDNRHHHPDNGEIRER